MLVTLRKQLLPERVIWLVERLPRMKQVDGWASANVELTKTKFWLDAELFAGDERLSEGGRKSNEAVKDALALFDLESLTVMVKLAFTSFCFVMFIEQEFPERVIMEVLIVPLFQLMAHESGSSSVKERLTKE